MNNYDELALRTESPIDEAMKVRVIGVLRILHAVAGVVTEAGEMMDALKKHIFYGKPFDFVNMAEESGDVEWYQALLRASLGGYTQQNIQFANYKKLEKRYPEKYSHESALNRDLNEERAALESGAIVQAPIPTNEIIDNVINTMNMLSEREELGAKFESTYERCYAKGCDKEGVVSIEGIEGKSCPDHIPQELIDSGTGQFEKAKQEFEDEAEPAMTPNQNLQARLDYLSHHLKEAQSAQNWTRCLQIVDGLYKIRMDIIRAGFKNKSIQMGVDPGAPEGDRTVVHEFDVKRGTLPEQYQFQAKDTSPKKRRHCGRCGSAAVRDSSMNPGAYICNECGAITEV